MLFHINFLKLGKVKNKKLTGSFYTPKVIADFLVNYVASKLSEHTEITILEPSAGDGIFVNSLFRHNTLNPKIKKVTAVEVDKEELDKIKITGRHFSAIHADFLEFQNKNDDEFNLVIGNPPYIKKNILNDKQLSYCKEIHQRASLSDIKPKNIWTAFLVRCIQFINEEGILAFVLPSELLQVKFAAELRELIFNNFERIEIFTFNELLFKDCKGQDTLLIIGEKKSNHKGIYYCNIERSTDLKEEKFTLLPNVSIRESKWTHHHLLTEEIELLHKLKKQIKTINHYCESKAGIVTAANNYFIVNTEIIEKYSLQEFVKPIIQKGSFINSSIIFTEEDFNKLIGELKPAYLIAINKLSKVKGNQKLIEYLDVGIKNGIDKRYKTLIRDNWYEVPNIGPAPQGFFFKRCNEFPKIVKNNANVLATDSAYLIKMREDYKLENLIYCFYNSLTLSFAELDGRYYGGGVLELTPNEFKGLPIPYFSVDSGNFNLLAKNFKDKLSLKEICKVNDRVILRTIDKSLDNESIDKIFRIREKLYQRRIKTN